jgi:hypothetical protein
MLTPLITEWDRIRQEMIVLIYQLGFKWVKITLEDGFVLRYPKHAWSKKIENICKKSNWKIEYIY